MNRKPTQNPAYPAGKELEVIEQRRRIRGGGFEVGRVLPFAKRRTVGPFIFFDHMGPLD